MALRDIFFTILTHFSVGLLVSILFLSLEEIGKLYFRVTTITALILIGFALLAAPTGEQAAAQVRLVFYVLTVATLVVYNLLMPRFHRPLLVVAAVLGLVGVVSHALTLLPEDQASLGTGALFVGTAVSSALLLGSVLAAMITGHWYLVQHKLSLEPLKTSSRLYLGSVFLRSLILAVVLAVSWEGLTQEGGLAFLDGFNFMSLVFVCRFVVGLLLPVVLGVMIWKTVLIRSTQSATGMLYATIVLVLVGETFARFLFFATNVPF